MFVLSITLSFDLLFYFFFLLLSVFGMSFSLLHISSFVSVCFEIPLLVVVCIVCVGSFEIQLSVL